MRGSWTGREGDGLKGRGKGGAGGDWGERAELEPHDQKIGSRLAP